MRAHLLRSVRPWQIVSVLRLVVPLVLLLVVALLRERGPVSEGRGALAWWGAALIVGGGGFAVFSSRGGASHGWLIEQLDLVQTGWLWALLMSTLFLPLLAASWVLAARSGGSESAGLESAGLESGNVESQNRTELSALVAGRWADSALAAACLRGTALGLALGAAVLLFSGFVSALYGAAGSGLWTPASLLFGQWWHQSRWPGPSAALLESALCLGAVGLAWLVLLPRVRRSSGALLAGTLASIVLASVLGPTLDVLPLGLAFPLTLASWLVPTFLMMRFGLVTGLLCAIVSRVVPGVLPWLQAQDSTLQAQGWIAVAIVMLPLVLTLSSVIPRDRDAAERS